MGSKIKNVVIVLLMILAFVYLGNQIILEREANIFSREEVKAEVVDLIENKSSKGSISHYVAIRKNNGDTVTAPISKLDYNKLSRCEGPIEFQLNYDIDGQILEARVK